MSSRAGTDKPFFHISFPPIRSLRFTITNRMETFLQALVFFLLSSSGHPFTLQRNHLIPNFRSDLHQTPRSSYRRPSALPPLFLRDNDSLGGGGYFSQRVTKNVRPKYDKDVSKRQNRHIHDFKKTDLVNHLSQLKESTPVLLDRMKHPVGKFYQGDIFEKIRENLLAWSEIPIESALAVASNENLFPPMMIESLIDRLIEEEKFFGGNLPNSNILMIEDYNLLLESWAAAASQAIPDCVEEKKENPKGDIGSLSTMLTGVGAARRAEWIVHHLQQSSQQSTSDSTVTPTSLPRCKPDDRSFLLVSTAWTRAVPTASNPTSAARSAHAFFNYSMNLFTSGENLNAKPRVKVYSLLMDAYAKTGAPDAGMKAESVLRNMPNNVKPNSYCYNMVINAYVRQGSRNKDSSPVQDDYHQSFKDAERILAEVEDLNVFNGRMGPDRISYSTVINAWASLEGGYAATRAEHWLRRMDTMARNMEECSISGNVISVSPNTKTFNAVLKAWCKSDDPRASYKSEVLLRQMEDRYMEGNYHCKPDRTSFNTLIHTLTKVGEEWAAQRAEDMLVRMKKLEASGRHDLSPNLFTYNQVILGWSRTSSEGSLGAQRAYAILRKMMERRPIGDAGTQNTHPTPNSYCFNAVIFALSKSDVPGAALLIERLLRYMELDPEMKPDVFGYGAAIHAWSRSGRRDAGRKAEQLMEYVEQRYEAGKTDVKLNTVTYNSAMDAWAKSGEGVLGARKAERLLQRMEELHKSGDDNVKPNSLSYNCVLSAWANSGTRGGHRKAEMLLDRMWKIYEETGDDEIKPDGCSFNTVIDAVSKSHRSDKAQKALRILRSMDKLYRAGTIENKPDEVTYTSVLNSCAFTPVEDEQAKKKAFDTAIFTLEELQESELYGNPNHVTYGTFFKACANLVPHDDYERSRNVVEQVFLQACRDGQVGEVVLTNLKNAVSAEVLDDLLGNVVVEGLEGKAAVTVRDLPAEWSCNVREKGKVKPFSRRRRGLKRP